MTTIYKFVYLFMGSFPKKGAKVIDKVIFALAGNALVYGVMRAVNVRRLRKAGRLDKFCVLVDMNIGDAVFAQGMVSAIRDFFPDARIDCVVKKSAGGLISGNPDISNLYAVYTGSPRPNEGDFESVSSVLSNGAYDVIFDISPFLRGERFYFPPETKVIGYFGMAASVLMAEKTKEGISQMAYQMHKFVYDLLSDIKAPERTADFKGVSVTIEPEAAKEACDFVQKAGVGAGEPKILFNPETSSSFTMVPLDMQIEMLRKLVDLPCAIFIGAGYIDPGIQSELLNAVPTEKRGKIKAVPKEMSLASYAAFVDLCDVYITGDTGPLHIAAARKVSRSAGVTFRNKTAIFSIFGMTPPRIYGYDSESSGFFPSNQDAVSRVYVADSPFRNILYLNKEMVTGVNGRNFFDGLDVDKIVEDVKSVCSSSNNGYKG